VPVFLQFRHWLSQGPARERMLAATSAAVLVVLLVLASLPLRDRGADDAAVSTSASAAGAGQTVTAGSGAATPGADAGPSPTTPGQSSTAASGGTGRPGASGTGGSSAAAASGGAGACGGLGASAPGITATTLTVGVSMVNLVGPVGNTAFQIRPDLHELADAVTDEINKTGGVACGRKLVIKKYDVNPIDQNDQQSKCLQMVQDKVFADVDNAGYITPVARACFTQNKLPLFGSTSAATHEIRGAYPYIINQTAPSEKQVRDGVLGLNELGFFQAPKFQKLGLLEDDCEPDINKELEGKLADIGVKSNQISRFVLSCALISPPNDILQGVLQHKAAGVTHVFLAASISNSQRYTQLAAQQNLRPVYGTQDYGTNTASVGDWDPSFIGALAITSQHSGELNSGIRSPETNDCDRIIKAHGLKGINVEREDGAAVGMCSSLFFFRQAINAAGANPTRPGLADGVARMGTWKAPANGSDGVFNKPGKVVGGDFHRSLQFDGGCTCWKIKGDPAFKPGF
jgi:hypothetical protein